MIVSRKREPTLPSSSITINDSPIARVDDLGVWITSTLNWSLQVDHVCKKARRQIGFLYRRFYRHANRETFLQLYLSYVRPHLEYASAVWDPHQQGLITSLENVQKFALRAVTKDWKAGYEHLVSTCNVPTLQQRRRLLKLCALYQMINGHLVLPDAPLEIRTLDRELRSTSQRRLLRPPARTNSHLFFILSSRHCTLE